MIEPLKLSLWGVPNTFQILFVCCLYSSVQKRWAEHTGTFTGSLKVGRHPIKILVLKDNYGWGNGGNQSRSFTKVGSRHRQFSAHEWIFIILHCYWFHHRSKRNSPSRLLRHEGRKIVTNLSPLDHSLPRQTSVKWVQEKTLESKSGQCVIDHIIMWVSICL